MSYQNLETRSFWKTACIWPKRCGLRLLSYQKYRKNSRNKSHAKSHWRCRLQFFQQDHILVAIDRQLQLPSSGNYAILASMPMQSKIRSRVTVLLPVMTTEKSQKI